MKKKLSAVSVSTLFLSLLLSSNASAGLISLDFNTLPSTQGWSFTKSATGSHSDDTESGTFSLNGSGSLIGDSMGSGLVSPSSVQYANAGIVDANLDWTLTWSMKIIDYEQGGNDNNFGSWFSVYNGTSYVGLALSDTELSAQTSTATGTDWSPSTTYGPTTMDKTFDTTDAFHTYEFSYTADTSTIGFGDWVLSIDGTTSLMGRSLASSGANGLYLGDGTGGANAKWALNAYSFDQSTGTPVPIPATILLLGTGIAGLAGTRIRRKKK